MTRLLAGPMGTTRLGWTARTCQRQPIVASS